MAWTRFAQTGFEMGRAGETPFSDSATPPEQHSTVRPITGELSFYQTGNGGLGYLIDTEPTIIRTSFTFNTVGSLESVPILAVYCREPSGFGQFVWYFSRNVVETDIRYIDSAGSVSDQDISDSTETIGFHSGVRATNHIGLVLKVGSGGFASFYVNGKKAMSFTASTPGMEQATAIFAIKIGDTDWGGSGMYETHFDDWYIDTGSGSESDACPPLKRFDIIRPNGAGSTTNWNPTSGNNYETVDDQIGNDNDYNYSSTTSDEDTFSFGNVTLPSDSVIDSVIPICRARAGTPSPSLNIRLVANDGVSGYGADNTLRLGYTYFWERMTTKPSGGSWSEADVNGAEFGYQLRA